MCQLIKIVCKVWITKTIGVIAPISMMGCKDNYATTEEQTVSLKQDYIKCIK